LWSFVFCPCQLCLFSGFSRILWMVSRGSLWHLEHTFALIMNSSDKMPQLPTDFLSSQAKVW
jgi:hypothetical protein